MSVIKREVNFLLESEVITNSGLLENIEVYDTYLDDNGNEFLIDAYTRTISSTFVETFFFEAKTQDSELVLPYVNYITINNKVNELLRNTPFDFTKTIIDKGAVYSYSGTALLSSLSGSDPDFTYWTPISSVGTLTLKTYAPPLASPTPTPTPTVTPSRTPKVTPSITPTLTRTPRATGTPVATPTPTVTRTPAVTPSITPTGTNLPTPTPTETRSFNYVTVNGTYSAAILL